MNYRSGVVTGILGSALLLGAMAAGWWLFVRQAAAETKKSTPPVPAIIAKEDQFNTITLTAEAEKSLAIKVGVIERKPMPRTRAYGGEVTIPPGQTIVVTAPFGGMVQTVSSEGLQAGTLVEKGKNILQLLPLLTPEGRANLTSEKVRADGEVRNSETQLESAKISLSLAQKLLSNGTGSQRMLNDAEAAFNLAEKVLQAAKDRQKTLDRIAGEVEKGTAAPIAIDAPASGILRNVSAANGQNVPSGAPLFEVLDPSTMWVRVPVYVGDLKDLDDKTAAQIGPLNSAADKKTPKAERIAAPPSADRLAGTVDYFFKIDNRETKYSPGERVGATLTLKTEAESLTMPWAALLYDINGGAWVYEKTGDHIYAHKRVIVRRVQGDVVVLAAGPKEGAESGHRRRRRTLRHRDRL